MKPSSWMAVGVVVVTVAGAVCSVTPMRRAQTVTGPIRSEALRQLASRAFTAQMRSGWLTATSTVSRLLATPLNAIAPPSTDFDGLGDGFVGPAGAMTVTVVSPDPSGDVGPNHYVEAVNAQLAVFDKTGVPILGPVPVNTLWSGFGGDCETNNDGRATVLYDPTPAYLLSLGTDSASLDLRTLAVDWQNPASSALDAPLTLPVGAWVMIRGYKSFAGVTLIGQY